MARSKRKENRYLDSARHVVMRTRNSLRYNFKWRPRLEAQKLARLASRGLNAHVSSELRRLSKVWVKWAGSGAASKYTRKIRVDSKLEVTSRHKILTFVGIGLDESIATRQLKKASLWKNISSGDAEDIFNIRSRTCDLIWAMNKPGGSPAPGSWEPISGHTPAVKRGLIPGTKLAITQGHATRDSLREKSIDSTRQDTGSPSPFGDTALMGALSTIKYMISPSTELQGVKGDMALMPTPRYTALTGPKDIRNPTHFDEMVSHVQEERERKKWEVGSVMMGNPRLSPLVPPVIRDYLGTHHNRPPEAMEAFRNDLHTSWFAPPVNRSPHSDTEDFTQHSLHSVVQRRGRALSDARELPRTPPPNSRGY